MGLLVDGAWKEDVPRARDGHFVRAATAYHNYITPDGSPGPAGKGGFPAEAGRYHLYVSLACPWASRTLIFRKLKKLEDVISVSVTKAHLGDAGWEFGSEPEATPDNVNGRSTLAEIYLLADPHYSGRVSVPVLWDKKPALTGWAGIPNGQWANHQRAKQDIGPHNATYGRTTIRIGSDWVDAPVATISHAYKVVAGPGLNARTGPATSYRRVRTYPDHATVQVICQAPGSAIVSTHLWDKLADGSYVSDYYVSTPSKTGYSPSLPRCAYPYQATATSGLRLRTGPGYSYRVSGRLAFGALAWVVCQQAGSLDGTTPVWDELRGSRWAPDYRVATPSKTRYSGPAPHCIAPGG